METVRVDGKGRVVLPKSVREKAGVREGGYVRIIAGEEGILIQPLKPIAEKYFGAFKIAEWPEDLDEFMVEVMRKWWTRKAT